MPRTRLYASAAARQQAYRDRQRRKALAPQVPCRHIGPHCTVYCSDWQDVSPLLPSHAAVITDPPYDANYDATQKRRHASQWPENFVGSDQPFDPTPWLRFPEVILFGAKRYWKALPKGGAWWCWDKMPGQDPADFSPDEWVWLSMPGPPRYYPHLWRGGMRAGEEHYVHLPKKHHVAQKPVNLLTDLVLETAAPVVIDPYMGSGTTLVACVRLGRPCIGIEIDPTYFAVACARLQYEVQNRAAQPPLPLATPSPPR